MIEVTNDNYADVLLYLTDIVKDITSGDNFYYEDMDDKNLTLNLKDCKGAIQYLKGSKSDNKCFIVVIETIKKSTKKAAIEKIDRYYQSIQQEINEQMAPVLNLELPKTKRLYLIPEKGKYVGYTRARKLNLI